MAKYLIVYGHGQGDPGAGGNGYTERDFTRNTLGTHLEKYSKQLTKNTVDFYDKSKNMYIQTQAGGGAYTVASSYSSITELHLDASGSSSSTGGHVIVKKGFSADKNDLAIAQVVNKYVGWWGSVKGTKGISYRSDLLNLNVFARRGISYRLVELGFITNKTDVNKLVKNIDAVAKELIEAITGEKLKGSAAAPKPSTPKPSTPKPSTPKPTTPAKKLKGEDLPNKGYYKVGVATNIRSGASTTASIVGSYNKGQGFNYDSKKIANGYVWLSYISYSGQRRYVAVV